MFSRFCGGSDNIVDADLFHAIRQILIAETGNAENTHTVLLCSNGFKSGGHTHRVTAKQAIGAGLCPCLQLRPGSAEIHALFQTNAESEGGLFRQTHEHGIVQAGHVGKARSHAFFVGTGERTLAGVVDLILNEHQGPGGKAGVYGTGGVCQNKSGSAQFRHDAHAHADLVRAFSFIQVTAALLKNNRYARQMAHRKGSPVGGRFRQGEIGKSLIGNFPEIFQGLRQISQSCAENQADNRGKTGGKRRFHELSALLDFFQLSHKVTSCLCPFPGE